MLDAAKLYAARQSNKTIAERLHKSTPYVKWLLEESVDWLVRQQERLALSERVETPQNRLEKELHDRFPHLQKVQIVSPGNMRREGDYATLIRQWGVAAAEYFDKLVEDAERRDGFLHVGVSGGETILEVMSQLRERDRPNVHFHATSLLGRGRLDKSSHVGPETNVMIGWARSGRNPGHCHFGTVPPYDCKGIRDEKTSDERREVIKRELSHWAQTEEIKKVIKNNEDLDVIFAGLGLVNPSGTNPAYSQSHIDRLTMTGLLKPLGIDPSELAAEGAIGDFSYCLFNADGNEQPRDAHGNELPKDRWRFFLSVGHYSTQHSGIEYYRQLVKEKKRVIVIAGVYKEPAIRAALKGKFFNVWFTDEETARNILAAP